jgi:FkbM family methyltransferase
MSWTKRLFAKVFLNWEHPLYSESLFKFSTKYLDMWYGDNNFDRTTNGEYHFLSFLIPKAKIAFDIGANVGDYSAEMLRINHSLTIHAFEPDQEAFRKLRLLPIIVNNFALGDHAEKRLLYREEGKTTHNSFYKIHSTARAPINVSVTTLDEYCYKNSITHIDFVKIDVEGFEYFVIKGAERLLAVKAIDYIQFEFSGATIESRTFLKDFLTFFKSHGYALYRIRATSVERVEYRPDKERFTLTNYVAAREGLPVQ